jgi:KDO2-lipid IV(A) lauroyltransferase
MARPLQKVKNDLIYYSARLLIGFLGFLPFSWMRPWGRTFGSVLFSLAGGERRKTLESLRTAYAGTLSEREIDRLGNSVWKGVGSNLFEIVRWKSLSRERIVSMVARESGVEHLEKALQKGKGALILTAHLGNWELLAAWLVKRHSTSAVAQNLYDPRFDRLITDLRENKMGVQMIKRGIALRAILEALRQNSICIALVDQDTGKDGVFVPFFNKQAWTQSGSARIAMKTGAALVPAFMVRGTDGRFEAHVKPEIEVKRTGDNERDILEMVRRYTSVVETYVRAYPDQWMWMHQRWKTRPEGEETPLETPSSRS